MTNLIAKILRLFMNSWSSAPLKAMPTAKPSLPEYKPQDMSKYEGISSNKLPQIWFPYYVFYKYSWTKNEYIVGFNSFVQADEFKTELEKKKDVEKLELYQDYPPEILKRGI